jgi:hemerythrin superfamily protein
VRFGTSSFEPFAESDIKYPQDRIRELEDHCEALENALEKIKAVTFEPKQTLPAVKRRIAKILLAVRDRKKKPAEAG